MHRFHHKKLQLVYTMRTGSLSFCLVIKLKLVVTGLYVKRITYFMVFLCSCSPHEPERGVHSFVWVYDLDLLNKMSRTILIRIFKYYFLKMVKMAGPVGATDIWLRCLFVLEDNLPFKNIFKDLMLLAWLRCLITGFRDIQFFQESVQLPWP